MTNVNHFVDFFFLQNANLPMKTSSWLCMPVYSHHLVCFNSTSFLQAYIHLSATSTPQNQIDRTPQPIFFFLFMLFPVVVDKKNPIK